MTIEVGQEQEFNLFNTILRVSIRNRYLILLLSVLCAVAGVYSYHELIIDALPDITNVQVQVNTKVQGYSPFEVEQRITLPIELLLAGIPNLEYTRSLSRYGLSQVTVAFKDGTDIHFARQQVAQRLAESKENLPSGVTPTMGPLTTGLGEILMFIVENAPGDHKGKTLQELRELQDWVVRPQLRTIPGVVEINSIGGYSKQIVVTPNLEKMRSYELSLDDLALAIAHNNSNVGAGYLEQNGAQFLIRVPAQVENYRDIGKVLIGVHQGMPVLIEDVASVELGAELRSGAATENGREVVLGTVYMLIGENGRDVANRVSEKLLEVSKSLPEGVLIKQVYNRATLVNATIATVRKNLLEGAALVVAILFLTLGNLRAALITACIIPLSMLITIVGMSQTRLSANLMSLGALDFGLIVDGAVILVENCVRRIGEAQGRLGRLLTREERLVQVYEASAEVRQATMFGELIIMVVYVPILALNGIEGKMYHPMALTVLLALAAAFVLSVTFVPAAVAIFVSGKIKEHGGIISRIEVVYRVILKAILKVPLLVIVAAAGLFVVSLMPLAKLGSEFIPSLDEGDVALHALRIPGTSLTQAVNMQHNLEEVIKTIPEVSHVFSSLGTPENATDPMPPSVADGYIIMKPRSEWADPRKPKGELVRQLEELVTKVPGNNYEFTQPIQMRFSELIAGVRSDVAVKIFGDDMEVLFANAEKVKNILDTIPGASDTKIEQVTGLPVVSIKPNLSKTARFGLSTAEIQDVVSTAYLGKEVSRFFAGDRSFPVVVRLPESDRTSIAALSSLPIPLPVESASHKPSIDVQPTQLELEVRDRSYVNLSDVADITVAEGPNQISRENGKRRVVVTANVRGRDLGSFVEEAQRRISAGFRLPPDYWLTWGGQYEHLISAQARLLIVVPIVLLSVFGLIFATFRSFTYSMLVFTGVPFALSGGIISLWLRNIPFSISAAVGFIALSGVSVLNGLVLVGFTRRLIRDGAEIGAAIMDGAASRLRPVCMTALVASLGFVPMAISEGTGSEVQRPLATVVIGGIISSMLLTLVVLPALIRVVHKRRVS